MECYYHPTRESTDTCAICGKSICKECGLELAGNMYCKDCLEKIVGTGLTQKPKKSPIAEAPRLEKNPESDFDMTSLTKAPAEVVQFSNQRVSEDSPYNIKDSIHYEGRVQSSYTQEVSIPEQPVENVRQEFIEPEPAHHARNEYIERQPQSDEFIYPDHSYEPPETSARQELEDKYERYLDDLYFDETPEIPLNEQLARDEAEYGSLTRKEYTPRHQQQEVQYHDSAMQTPGQQRSLSDEEEIERRVREELARRENPGHYTPRESIHNIEYKEEKEPYSAVDILLTIILIIVIIIVLLYILYVFRLSVTYPTFFDAVMGLKNPGQFINALAH